MPSGAQLLPGCRVIGAALFGCALLVAGTPLAAAAPTAPRPTSSLASPSAPNPHPPAGGLAPDGTVPGGARLASRGLVVPTGSPALPKNIGAHSWILADLDTGAVLAARDPHGRYQPASVLKLLTAITVLPKLPGSKLVTISARAAAAEGSAVGLLTGARYSVDQLFQAMLLVSANDAATALAEANGGVASTVAQMNAEIARLGGYDTLVQTPSGLDGWQQLTSAYDLALVLRAAVQQPRLVGYDRLPRASYPPKASRYGKVGVYEFDNQNQDFFNAVPGAVLAKSGYTDAAQHTYLAAARRNGHTLGVILLRDQRVPLDQYQQAAALFDWGFSLPGTVQPVGTLAGPITPAAYRAGPAVAREQTGGVDFEAPSLSGALSANDRWLVLAPISAAIAGGLWLGCVAVAGGRVLRRRARRRR
ncbi:MAG TPA: serine hydrolase [Jatrophihabitans sp.]|nr:serine hydrolase [Jatrophihabitans sp.]